MSGGKCKQSSYERKAWLNFLVGTWLLRLQFSCSPQPEQDDCGKLEADWRFSTSMNNHIKCPSCGEEIEISEAIRAEADEEVNKAKKELAESLSLIRELKNKDKDREVEMQKRLMREEERIKADALKVYREEHELKEQEKEKIIADLKKDLEAAQRKATQGSQQTQGEVMELELEEMLRREFPDDEISEVKKGVRGADVTQTVKDKMGRMCGRILWESKNAQWSEGWLSKLRDDQREAKAELAVLVVENAPEGVTTFTYRDRVWVTKRKFAVPLALALRFDLVHLYFEKMSNVGKDEKMEVLYQYLTGSEFKHRIEAIVDAFSNLQETVEKEKRYFSVKWAREEKEIRKIIDSTHGMWGDLQAVTNRSLPSIKSLEITEGNSTEQNLS